MFKIIKGGHATDIAKKIRQQLHPGRNYQNAFMADAAQTNSAPPSGSGQGNVGTVGSTGSDVGTYQSVSVPGNKPSADSYGSYSGATGKKAPATPYPSGTVLKVSGVSDLPLKGLGGDAGAEDLRYGDAQNLNSHQI
jgi:hypothetical protein